MKNDGKTVGQQLAERIRRALGRRSSDLRDYLLGLQLYRPFLQKKEAVAELTDHQIANLAQGAVRNPRGNKYARFHRLLKERPLIFLNLSRSPLHRIREEREREERIEDQRSVLLRVTRPAEARKLWHTAIHVILQRTAPESWARRQDDFLDRFYPAGFDEDDELVVAVAPDWEAFEAGELRPGDEHDHVADRILRGIRGKVESALAQAGATGILLVIPDMQPRESIRRWRERVLGPSPARRTGTCQRVL